MKAVWCLTAVATGFTGPTLTLVSDPLGCPYMNDQGWDKINVMPPPPDQSCAAFAIECQTGDCEDGKYCGDDIHVTSFRSKNVFLRATKGYYKGDGVDGVGSVLFLNQIPGGIKLLMGVYSSRGGTCADYATHPKLGELTVMEPSNNRFNASCVFWDANVVNPGVVPDINTMISACLDVCPEKRVWGMADEWNQFEGVCEHVTPWTPEPTEEECSSDEAAKCLLECGTCLECEDGASCFSESGFFCAVCMNCNYYRPCLSM